MSFSVIVSNRCDRAEWGFPWSVLWVSANCILLLPTLAQESHILVISIRCGKGWEIYCLKEHCPLPWAQPDRQFIHVQMDLFQNQRVTIKLHPLSLLIPIVFVLNLKKKVLITSVCIYYTKKDNLSLLCKDQSFNNFILLLVG